MRTLRSLAEESKLLLDNGVEVTKLRIRFEQATAEAAEIAKHNIVSAHSTKNCVKINDKILFGELAILHLLETDNWQGIWIDSYLRRLWKTMPYQTADQMTLDDLPLRPRLLFNKVLRRNLTGEGKPTWKGFFDVLAWNEAGEYAFLEFKGEGDRRDGLAPDQEVWAKRAVDAGVAQNSLFLVSFS